MADLQEVKIHSELSNSEKTAQLQGDHHLEEERTPRDPVFNRATLQIDAPSINGGDSGVTFAGTATVRTVSENDPDTGRGAQNLSRERPKSAMTKGSLASTTSFDESKYMPDKLIEKFFSLKPGAFEHAVQIIKSDAVKADLDGNVTGAWLLTQIDHWDNEKEVVVLLTDNSLMLARYDFVGNVVKETKRVMLHIIDAIQVGDLEYPASSFMTPRKYGGVRAFWSKGSEPSFGQKWNPFCSDIPYLTLAHHPAIYNQKERETITFNVDDFFESLVQAVKNSYEQKNPGRDVVVQECKIEIGSYLSLSSMVHNQSYIGFSRERGGVSF